MCHLGPPYIGQGVSCAGQEGLLCRPEGLLYQVKSLLFWPGASCVLKWASLGHRASYINHGASRNRGPPAYTRRHVPCVSQGLLTSARASLYLPGPPEWVKTCFLHWPEELLYQAKGLLYRPGGLLCRPEGLYQAKDLLYRSGGLLHG